MNSSPPPVASAPTSITAASFATPDPFVAPRRLWRRTREAVLPVLLVAALFAAWEILVPVLKIPVYILPSPGRIVAALWLIRESVAQHFLATLGTVMAGFVLAILLALPLAALITVSWFGRVAIYPLLILSQSIPKIALAPILVLLLGTGMLPKIVITMLVAFFPLVVTTAAGLSAVPADLIELGRSLQASTFKQLWRIRLPYAVPFVFSGLKMAITLAVIGAVVGEFVAADRGLGYLMTSSLAFFNTPVAYGAIMLLSLMAMALFQAIVALEHLFFPWSVRLRS